MGHKKWKWMLRVSGLMALIPFFASAQVEAIIGGKSISITNNSSVEISYSVRYENSDWANNSLLPNETADYDLGDRYLKLIIYVGTGGGGRFVQYSLDRGRKYSIQWNYERQLWDVYKIKLPLDDDYIDDR